MRKRLIQALLMMFPLVGCEPPHAVIQSNIYGANYRAIRQYSSVTGKTVSLENKNQYLYISLDTLWVERNDSTILMLPNIKKNNVLGAEKRGLIVFEASTPEGLKSIRITLGENYRKHAESSPLTLGQVVEGTYDASLDTVQTVYEMEEGLFRK